MYVLFFCLGEGKSSSELKPVGLNSIVKKYYVQVQLLKSNDIFNTKRTRYHFKYHSTKVLF